MLYLTCTTITSIDLAHYGVSRAKDWVSVKCGTNWLYWLYYMFMKFCALPFQIGHMSVAPSVHRTMHIVLNLKFSKLKTSCQCRNIDFNTTAQRYGPLGEYLLEFE